MSGRSIERVVTAHQQLEGGGFPVRRPIPTRGMELVDPFLLLDQMGPVDWGPGQAIGAPDHPHRGFETVTYVLEGTMQHKDSSGHAGTLGPGDVQWMTAGAGVVHSELPEDAFRKRGGTMHGFQLWVNLPKVDKMMRPRYQDIPSAEIPNAKSEDGKVTARVIAGESLGVSAVIDTRTPISYLHFTIEPGGSVAQPIPRDFNVFAYVFRGGVRFGRASVDSATEGQLALFAGDGDLVEISVGDDAAGAAELLLIGGQPIGEPVARYGPFVMNTREEIMKAFEDYQAGRMGNIDF